MKLRPFLTLIAACLALAAQHRLQALPVEPPPPQPVRMLNTNGSAKETDWTVVTGMPTGLDPKNVVLENGLVRVAHPATFAWERAGHVLYLKLGTKWILAGDAEYGDWTYTGSSFHDAPTAFEILQNTEAVASIRLTFANHVHEYMGNMPLPVKKTLVLHRNAYGYRAMVSVPSAVGAEREIGFGGTKTHLFSFTSKYGILWNPRQPPPANAPDPTDYEWIRSEGQPEGDWWGASLAFSNSYYRMVSVRPSNPGGIRTGQFSGGHTGHLIHWAYTGFSNYEAYIAAVPYDARYARRVLVRKDIANVHVAKSGTYTLFTLSVVGRRLTYIPVRHNLQLKAGFNNISVKGIAMRGGIVVPVSNGKDYPEDISALYRAGAFD